MSGAERDRLAALARGWVGTPYVHQGSRRGAGADCLGLVLGVWREAFGAAPDLPDDYSPDWNAGSGGARLEAAARRLLVLRVPPVVPGAVLLFRLRPRGAARHLALAVSGEAVVHAVSGLGVVESPLSLPWRRRMVAMFDFPDLQGRRSLSLPHIS